MRQILSWTMLLSFVVSLAAAEPLEKAPVNPDTVEIFAARNAWEYAAKTGDAAAALALLTDDATVLPPQQPSLQGKQAIGAYYTKNFADKAFAMNREPANVEVSGETAYTVGNYIAQRTGADGAVLSDQGKYVRIWRKQPDKTWKIAVDVWNHNPKE